MGSSVVNNANRAAANQQSGGSTPAAKSSSPSTSSTKSGSVPSDRQASSVNKVDVSSSKTGDASKRISDSQIADGKFKATSETSVGALAQKINDDGKGNVDSSAVKQSVKDIVDKNPELKEAAKDLDPNDPNYEQKLADLKIKEGEEVTLPDSKKAEEKGTSESGGEPSSSEGGGGGGESGAAEGGQAATPTAQTDQAKPSSNPNDQITQLVQAALQAISSKDANAATQLLSQIQSMISDLENASGGQVSGTPSDKANESVNKINSGQSLSNQDKEQITNILKSGSPADKIAVLKSLQNRLQGIAGQAGFGNSNSSDPLAASMSNQAIYNLAGLNMNGGVGTNTGLNGVSNLKTSGNVNVTTA